MKKLLFIFTALFTLSATAGPVEIKIDDVVNRISKENFNVYENALRVYQAKENITKVRGDMLPKLNVWKIVGMVFDVTSWVDRITDVAPFLVPGNWFRLEEVKLLHLAEKEGYRALWGNEVNIAKSMYLNLLLDEQLLGHVKTSIEDLRKVHRIVKTRETFGEIPPGSAREVEIRLLGLVEDQKNLEVLLAKEYTELSYILGYSADVELKLTPVEIPNIEDLKPINPKEYEFRALSLSPERRQFDHFLSVVSQIEKEIRYSFLGVSEFSRGVAGGIFDNLPVPDGLGFGSGAAMNMAKAQKEILRSQKRGVEETLKRQLANSATLFNSDIESYQIFTRRLQLANESKTAILRRIQLGEKVDVLLLFDSSRNQILAQSALLGIQHRFVSSIDRLNRMIFSGDYEKAPPLIDSLKGVKP